MTENPNPNPLDSVAPTATQPEAVPAHEPSQSNDSSVVEVSAELPNTSEQSKVLGAAYTTPEPRRRVRRRRRKGGIFRKVLKRLGLQRRIGGLLVGVVTALVVAIVVYAVLVVDSLNSVNNAVSNMERVLATLQLETGTELSMTDYDRVVGGLTRLDNALRDAQNRIVLLRPFQTWNVSLDVSIRTVDISRSLSLSGRAMLNGVEPALNYLVGGISPDGTNTQVSSGDRLVELLEIGSVPFSRSTIRLNEAAVLISELNVENAPRELVRTAERILDVYDQLSNINGVFSNAPDLLTELLGLNEDKTYLILAVNSDELRPSGGFLSTWGWFTVRSGRIIEYDYSASTVNSPAAPASDLAYTFPVPNWWIQFRQPLYAAWDGSWFADFPSTAAMAMWYYNNGENTNRPVDGVISLDLYAFEYLLEVLGSVTVPGYEDRPVTAENFRDVVYNIRAYSTGPEPHKAFVALMYRHIMEEWQSASRDPQQNTEILGALLLAAQEKHLMITLGEDELNRAIDLLSWSGSQELNRDGSDYLMVVESNLTNKSSRSIRRGYTYDVTLNPDFSASKRLTLNYELPASVAENDPAVDPDYHGPLDYTSMVQIYAPQGSDLTEYARDVNLPTEFVSNNLWLISTSFITPYDGQRRIQFEYTTPDAHARNGNFGRYRLEIEKQAGTDRDPITVQITLPPRTRVTESIPQISTSFNVETLIVEYQLNLQTDQYIDLIFEYRNPNDPD